MSEPSERHQYLKRIYQNMNGKRPEKRGGPPLIMSGATSLDNLLARRRWADLYEKNRLGQATDLALFEAMLAAFVPDSPQARIAKVRKLEAIYRRLGADAPMRLVAAWRLKHQLTD
jgi:hypothetical protein